MDTCSYLTELRWGVPSYEPLPTHVHHNIISANYGGSQAFDTDDGSSWYDIHHNFWFDSDGFKMDYVSLPPL